MAKAKAGARQTTRKVKLELTEGEADLVLALAAGVFGHPSQSPAKYARRVEKALTEALGYGPEETDAFHLSLGTVALFNYDDHPEIEESDRVIDHLSSHGFQLQADHYDELRNGLAVVLEEVSGVPA